MQMQKPGGQIMCAVRSSAIVLPKDWKKQRAGETWAGYECFQYHMGVS